jgi:hypothetical protein
MLKVYSPFRNVEPSYTVNRPVGPPLGPPVPTVGD